MIREAVVIAAGAGSRLRPLTDTWPKAILPIDGRPVVVTLLRELKEAGIERVTVVTGHLAEQVERLLTGFPLELRFVRQPSRDGSADALKLGLAGLPTLVAAADTVFTPGDVAAFAHSFAESGADGAIAVRRDPPANPPQSAAVRVEAGRVTRVLDDDPANPLAGAPLWALGEALAELLCLDAKPHEIAKAFQRAIDAGMTVVGIEVGRTRDLTHPSDVIERNFPYLRDQR